MVDYVLKRDENGMVRYLYRNDGKHPVEGKCRFESAVWMLENDKKRRVRRSDEYAGFPLTADGVYFFEAEVGVREDGGETTSSAPDGAPSPEPTASLPGEGSGVAYGADCCEISEEKKTKRKKRTKDEVCE